MAELTLHPDDIVVIRASEDWPEHLFRVDFVFDDCVGGYSITGPLKGEYGEPDFDLILRAHERGT
ncbi:hypothetical protein [Shimia marina]|uniref:Uncharacterized protein n=1 Tax=Shimia marina TaxID=321267 RepID=A0A0P1FDN0_9RHOB|nr:hypothetical protein [Shimia marina]CUH52719.1 hypothetical protein SHM7688_02166 [Shimia marina]SFE82839.1 hypothetical protein SAMN04488037_1295 [Shimia marina]